MLNIVAGANVELIVAPGSELLGHISSLVNDSWWEVQIQLLIVSSSILKVLPSSSTYTRPIYSIIDRIFTEASHLNVKKIGLSYLGKVSIEHSCLIPRYLKVLLSLDKLSQQSLLNSGGSSDRVLPLTGTNGSKYFINCLASEWNGASIALELGTEVKKMGMDHLEPEHLNIILAAVTQNDGTPDPNIEQRIDQWILAFSSLQDYIFVALCDPVCVDVVSRALIILISCGSLGQLILKNKRLLGSLELIFPGGASSGDSLCQEKCFSFYNDVLQMNSGGYREIITKLISDFAAKYPERINKFAILGKLVHLIGGLKGK
jgi:hypothetical protein